MIERSLVSCIIPTYKRCDTLVRAVDSVLNQTYPHIEVLVVNDNNPDDEYTEQVKTALKIYEGDDRVRLIIQDKHVNGAVARNVGIRAATGEYIGFLDDDDEWEPEKASKQVEFLKDHPDMAACVCLCSVYYNGVKTQTPAPYSNIDLQFNVLLRHVGIGTPAFLGKKECITDTRMFDEALLRHQELQFFAHFLDKYNIGVIDEHLVKIHGDDNANRPDLKSFVLRKREWFYSINDVLKKYTAFKRHRIKCAHAFEILYIAIKQRNILYILLCICYINLFIPAYFDLCKRIKGRNIS